MSIIWEGVADRFPACASDFSRARRLDAPWLDRMDRHFDERASTTPAVHAPRNCFQRNC